MADRDITRDIVTNGHAGYSDILKRRGITKITQYGRRHIPAVTVDERKSLTQMRYIYKTGDKLYKIAHDHYGDSKLWWLLAWWNRKPTDFHCRVGDTIFIPFPLKEALYIANKKI